MAGTVTLADRKVKSILDTRERITIVRADWVGDASGGSVPDTQLTGLYGYLKKVITNPGAVAPTDNYDIKLLDAEDATADALNGLAADRDTANTEVLLPAVPPLLCGDYTLNITGNSVNSATGSVILFISNMPS